MTLGGQTSPLPPPPKGGHAPGLWRIDTMDAYSRFQVLACAERGEGCERWDPVCSGIRSVADARLIAAAPDLLDALKMAKAHLGWTDCTLENVHLICRKAIAKATGAHE